MSNDNVIDAEVVEVVETANVPAVIEHGASSSGPMELPNRQDTLLTDNAGRRCVAHKSNGERCRKFAILGATVCRTHGGATKAVKNSARIRVENASNKLMGKLIEFAFDDTKPPDVQLRAMRDALDRAGLRAPAEVVLSQGETKPYEVVFDSIGGTPPAEWPSVPSGYEPAGRGTDVEDVGIFSVPAQPHPANQSPPSDQARPRSEGGHADTYADGYDDTPEHDGPPQPPRPRDRDRNWDDQPTARHITGDAAMRAANWANAAMAESHGLPWGESDRRRR